MRKKMRTISGDSAARSATDNHNKLTSFYLLGPGMEFLLGRSLDDLVSRKIDDLIEEPARTRKHARIEELTSSISVWTIERTQLDILPERDKELCRLIQEARAEAVNLSYMKVRNHAGQN
jgi:hypothetical protein